MASSARQSREVGAMKTELARARTDAEAAVDGAAEAFRNTHKEMTMKAPCAVNKFIDETDAVTHAREWSKEKCWPEWSVIHAPSVDGLAFFVERGDGGMIRNTERLVGRYRNGKPVPF